MIDLTHGGTFDENDLAQHIRHSGRNYIIQGQTACAQADHPKPSSLDFWLRSFASSPDTKQADNQVVAALVETGIFQESEDLICPDSGNLCKGLVLTA